MKKLRMGIIKELNGLWKGLFKKGIINEKTAVILMYKTTYFFGKKRKE